MSGRNKKMMMVVSKYTVKSHKPSGVAPLNKCQEASIWEKSDRLTGRNLIDPVSADQPPKKKENVFSGGQEEKLIRCRNCPVSLTDRESSFPSVSLIFSYSTGVKVQLYLKKGQVKLNQEEKKKGGTKFNWRHWQNEAFRWSFFSRLFSDVMKTLWEE